MIVISGSLRPRRRSEAMAANILAMDPTTGARAADPPLELHSMGSDGFGGAPAGYLPDDQFATKWSLQGHAELHEHAEALCRGGLRPEQTLILLG